jgi:hypothetical protein
MLGSKPATTVPPKVGAVEVPPTNVVDDVLKVIPPKP